MNYCWLAAILCFGAIAKAAPELAPSPFAVAQVLARDGNEDQAFAHYVRIPGAESAALDLARPKAEHFLALLRGLKDAPEISRHLVEGDLLLALKRRDEALKSYRAAAQALESEAQSDRTQNFLPRRPYAVEFSARSADAEQPLNVASRGPLESFQSGPGSHRDNWLLRRFIGLEAWDDAAREFARVWEIHRALTQPYLVEQNVYSADDKTRTPKIFVVRPAGFSAFGRQFAIDYAYFLKRRAQPDNAFAVLRDVTLAVDVEPKTAGWIEASDAEKSLPRRAAAPRDSSRFWGRPAPGLTAQDFLRLAYGAAKMQGRENDLLGAVRGQIEKGDNGARRVLATLLLHAGQPDAALKIELDFIAGAQFSPPEAARRRGMVYEEFAKNAEAAAAYEEALQLPFEAKAGAPDGQIAPSGLPPGIVFASPLDAKTRFQMSVLPRLERIYGALGQRDKALDLVLRQLELGNEEQARYEDVAARFKAAGQEARFTEWAKERVGKITAPAQRAELAWLLDDRQATIAALAEASRADAKFVYSLQSWKERFKKIGEPSLRALLEAVTKANPRDVLSQLELLELEGRASGPALIAAWEALLEADPDLIRERYRGPRLPQRFKSHYQLAYQLARLYQKNGQNEKLQALALRVARHDKPFEQYQNQNDYGSFNGMTEHANAMLALAIQDARDDKTLDALATALDKSPWQSARAQLARRMAQTANAKMVNAKTAAASTFGWANLPPGVQLLACNDNVLSLCRDRARVYAGHPWGVAIYDLEGRPVTRVALGEAALDLAVCGGALWVGTPVGLSRVDLKTFAISYLSCDQDVDPRTLKGSPEMRDFYNGVRSLAAQGDVLWIGTWRDVRTLNTRTNALRIFSQEELRKRSSGGCQRFLFDGPYVWADGDGGFRRYDTRSGQWQAPIEPGPRDPSHLIGMIDGQLWGNVWLNDELRNRPCLIDRNTLQITPISIAGNLSRDERLVNQPFGFAGRYKGQLVFRAAGRAYVFDAENGKLRRLGSFGEPFKEPIENDAPSEARGDTFWRRPDGALVSNNDDAPLLALKLPDGAWVTGRRLDATRYQYPREDWPFNKHPRNVADEAGGLKFVSATGEPRRVSSAPRADVLRGDTVFAAVADGARTWLCTNRGLAVLDGQGRVTNTYTQSDGLLANHITSGAASERRLYFASRWDDAKGGLLVFDPATGVFTTLFSEDGLSSDALEGVAPDPARPGALALTYGVQYRRWANFSYQQLPPGWFRPASGEFSPPAPPRIMDQTAAYAALPKPRLGAMPFLGGRIIAKQIIGGRTYLCGTRGALVLGDNEVVPLKPAPLVVRVMLDPRQNQLADARQRKVEIASSAQLATALRDPNPFYRANALASLLGKSKLLQDAAVQKRIVSQLGATESNLRGTALYLLTRTKNSLSEAEVVPLLQKRLTDAEPSIRYAATMELCRRGQIPDMRLLREAWKGGMTSTNVPFGAEFSIGLEGGATWALQSAVAPHATPDIFALLLEYPTNYDLDYGEWPGILRDFGASLRQRPAAASVLLHAYDSDKHNSWQVRVAQLVFKQAGKPLLPVLHQALTSPERVVRSNAARACGAIGDQSSVAPLIAALDMESGLSRASIVWALGELKARTALPKLVDIYRDARRDEARGHAAGFMVQQSAAQIGGQFLMHNVAQRVTGDYAALKDIDAVGGEWDELKSVANPPLDPLRNEPLLTAQNVLEAVRKIGPQFAQEFYRGLAGAPDDQTRAEAARGLAETGDDAAGRAELLKNLPVLRSLLTQGGTAGSAAAVSLLVAGQNDGQTLILQELAAHWPIAILQELQRVEDNARLKFARAALSAIVKNTKPDDNTHKLARDLLDFQP